MEENIENKIYIKEEFEPISKVKLIHGYEDTGFIKDVQEFINRDDIQIIDFKYSSTPDFRENDLYNSVLIIYNEKKNIIKNEPIDKSNIDNSINVQDKEEHNDYLKSNELSDELLDNTYTYMEVPDKEENIEILDV